MFTTSHDFDTTTAAISTKIEIDADVNATTSKSPIDEGIAIRFPDEETTDIFRQTTDATSLSTESAEVLITTESTKLRDDSLSTTKSSVQKCIYKGAVYFEGDELPPRPDCKDNCVCIGGRIYCDVAACHKSKMFSNCHETRIDKQCCDSRNCCEFEYL